MATDVTRNTSQLCLYRIKVYSSRILPWQCCKNLRSNSVVAGSHNANCSLMKLMCIIYAAPEGKVNKWQRFFKLQLMRQTGKLKFKAYLLLNINEIAALANNGYSGKAMG